MVRVEYEGHPLLKAWPGRLMWELKDHKSVEKWPRDYRHCNDDPDKLIWHPIVEPPTSAEKKMYSKQWQPEFFEEHGTVVPEGTTMNDCRKYTVLIARNVGGFPINDYFRAYTRSSGTGKRSSQGDWYEIVSGEKADMHADWYTQVTSKGYLKYLSLSESEHLEWYLDYELRLKASNSYKLFKQQYKKVYGQPRQKRKKKNGEKVEKSEKKVEKKVEEVVEIVEEEEEEAAPPQADDVEDVVGKKRKIRSDLGVSRNKITNLRVVTDDACITTRQIKYNGKWHGLLEVSIVIVVI